MAGADETARPLRPRLRPIRLDRAGDGARAASGSGEPGRDLDAAHLHSRSHLHRPASLRVPAPAGSVPVLAGRGAPGRLDGGPRPGRHLALTEHGLAALRALAPRAERRAVAVDTSKGASRAWWLWQSGEVDLSFVWLTRRLEGVIRSQVRHGNSALKTAVSWRLAQRQAGQMARAAERAGLQVPRISYERLVQEPRAILGEVLAHVGLPWYEAVLTPRPAHTIGGEHDGKHGGRLSIEASGRAPAPLPLASRLAVRLIDPAGSDA